MLLHCLHTTVTFVVIPLDRKVQCEIARHMSLWSHISFFLAVVINLLVSFFYPFDKGSQILGMLAHLHRSNSPLFMLSFFLCRRYILERFSVTMGAPWHDSELPGVYRKQVQKGVLHSCYHCCSTSYYHPGNSTHPFHTGFHTGMCVVLYQLLCTESSVGVAVRRMCHMNTLT